MESRWMSACVRGPVHNISAHYLASSASVFSEDFIENLSKDLDFSWEQLSKELGLSTVNKKPAQELYNWCSSPGSTVFVLISVLSTLGLTDSVRKIEHYIQSKVMQLFVQVEEAVTEGQGQPAAAIIKFHQVVTNCEFSLLRSLDIVFGEELVFYEIVGPGSWVTWTTLCEELKGQQLTLVHHSQSVPATRLALNTPREADTELKKPVEPQNFDVVDDSNDVTHVKVLECAQIEVLKLSQEPSFQVSSSNNLTLSGSFNKEKDITGSLSVGEPTKTHSLVSLDSTDHQFTPDHRTQLKACITGNHNTPDHEQVVKHFPDKILYKEKNSKEIMSDLAANQELPLEILNNVPRLSLLNGELESLLPEMERPPFEAVWVEKQEKLNNLNFQNKLSYTKQCLDEHSCVKTCQVGSGTLVANTTPDSELPCAQSQNYCSYKVSDSVFKTYTICEAELEKCSVLDSLFTQGRSSQVADISSFPSGDTFLPYMEPSGQHFENDISDVKNGSPSVCIHEGPEVTPPQTSHRRDHEMPTRVVSSEPQQHLLQQTILDAQIFKLKQLQLQQLQLNQMTSSQMTSCHMTSLCTDPQDQIWPQQHQIYQVDQVNQSSPHENNSWWGQCSAPSDQNGHSQTYHLTHKPQVHEPLQNLQQTQQESHLSFSPFIKSTASPFLICHTPPPGFPDDKRKLAESEQRHALESDVFQNERPNPETCPASYFVGKLGHVTKIDTGYMTMRRPNCEEIGDSGIKSVIGDSGIKSVRSDVSLGQFMLQNVEFTNPNRVTRSRNPWSSDGSSSSSFTECQGRQTLTFTEDYNSFMTPQPFYPAPPLLDALGRRIHSSLPTQDDVFIKDLGKSGLSNQENYNFTHIGQFFRSKSLPSRHSHKMRAAVRLEDELLHLDGWCPLENGDTIKDTMNKYLSQDGNYIIWKSRRHRKFIITVSHLKQLFHFRVEEGPNQNKPGRIYYLFEGGYSSLSLLDLVQHYRQDGIRIPVRPEGSSHTYFENIHLNFPLKVNIETKRKNMARLK